MQRQLAPAFRRAEARWATCGAWLSCHEPGNQVASTWFTSIKNNLSVYSLNLLTGQPCEDASRFATTWKIQRKWGQDEGERKKTNSLSDLVCPLAAAVASDYMITMCRSILSGGRPLDG